MVFKRVPTRIRTRVSSLRVKANTKYATPSAVQDACGRCTHYFKKKLDTVYELLAHCLTAPRQGEVPPVVPLVPPAGQIRRGARGGDAGRVSGGGAALVPSGPLRRRGARLPRNNMPVN